MQIKETLRVNIKYSKRVSPCGTFQGLNLTLNASIGDSGSLPCLTKHSAVVVRLWEGASVYCSLYFKTVSSANIKGSSRIGTHSAVRCSFHTHYPSSVARHGLQARDSRIPALSTSSSLALPLSFTSLSYHRQRAPGRSGDLPVAIWSSDDINRSRVIAA